MTFKKTLLALGLLAASGAAMAENGGYLGVSTGSATYKDAAVDNSSAMTVYAGWRTYNNPFGIEVAYFDLGDSDITGGTMNMSGFNFSATLSTAGYSRSPLAFFGKLGFYSMDTDFTGVALRDKGTGLSYGVGVEYSPARQFGVRAEIQGFANAPDAANDDDVTVISVGINVKF